MNQSINKQMEQVIIMMQRNNELFFPHLMKFPREKNLWIARVLTISSAILGGGILIFQRQENLVIQIGLALIFFVICIGLIFIYKENRDLENRLRKAYGRQTDYNLKLIELLRLLGKEKLTPEEQKQGQKISDYLLKNLKEIGFITEDGGIGGVEQKLLEGKNGDLGSYFLIIGFFVAGLILIFANYIPKIPSFVMSFFS